MTFSVVLADPHADEGPRIGVAVASKFLAAGAVVPSARAQVGAIATQAMANLRYPAQVLDLLERGYAPQRAVDAVTEADEQSQHRQLSVVAADGRSATFTGSSCLDWAGARHGPGFAVAGNLLASARVIDDMAEVAEQVLGQHDVSLARRLHAVLAAGDAAGGDRRGRQSAGVLVIGSAAGYGGGSDVAVDLRVDDHADPVAELRRLLDIHELLFGRSAVLLPIEGSVAERLARALATLGYPTDDLEASLALVAGIENLEERLAPGEVDPVVLEFLEAKATQT